MKNGRLRPQEYQSNLELILRKCLENYTWFIISYILIFFVLWRVNLDWKLAGKICLQFDFRPRTPENVFGRALVSITWNQLFLHTFKRLLCIEFFCHRPNKYWTNKNKPLNEWRFPWLEEKIVKRRASKWRLKNNIICLLKVNDNHKTISNVL